MSGRTNVGRTNVLFMDMPDKCRIFSFWSMSIYLRVGQMSWSESWLNVGRTNVGRTKVTAVVIKPEHNFSEKSYSKKSQQHLK